jgi:NADPH:quinone reductase-like Zn-dependent oxidoreductase
VIATCSKRNFDYVKSLGAAEVFDYKHPNVTQEVAAELDKGTCAGIFMAAGFDVGNVAACKVAAASKQKVPSTVTLLAPPIHETDKAPASLIFHRPILLSI